MEVGESPCWSQAAAALPWAFSVLYAFTHTTQAHHLHPLQMVQRELNWSEVVS